MFPGAGFFEIQIHWGSGSCQTRCGAGKSYGRRRNNHGRYNICCMPGPFFANKILQGTDWSNFIAEPGCFRTMPSLRLAKSAKYSISMAALPPSLLANWELKGSCLKCHSHRQESNRRPSMASNGDRADTKVPLQLGRACAKRGIKKKFAPG